MGCNETRDKSKINGRKNEGFLHNSPVQDTDPYLLKVSRSICKIATKMQFGTGFLLKHLIERENYYFLISNEHIITNDMIKNQEEIEVQFDNEFTKIKIVLNQKERYIKAFKGLDNINLDITVVQILPKDCIEDSYFLLAGENINNFNKNNLINMNIYIPQYPQGKNMKKAEGTIKRIDDNEIAHLASTNNGSSGSPIFLKNTIKVIGIHKQGDTALIENYGDFIYPIFDIIKKDLDEVKKLRDEKQNEENKIVVRNKTENDNNADKKIDISNNKEEIEKNEKTQNSDYKVDPKHINLGNETVKIYYENGNLRYEGGLINGNFEGNGKYIYEDGEYYIGQWKNGLKHGKGILYNKNGNIIYEGDYVNGKKEGNGKFILESGEYYIGQFKDDAFNGKGKLYYKNGKVIYDGDFVNQKREGYGKYYYGTGEYYEGQWKNNLKNGK